MIPEHLEIQRHLAFQWPLIETPVGQALADYERALVEECVFSIDENFHQRTHAFRERLVLEIMKLYVLGFSPDESRPVWLEPELRRLGMRIE